VGTLADFLHVLNLVLFTVVAVVALREWRAGRGRAGVWAALAFLALALVVDVSAALPENPETTFERVAQRFVIAALVLFPYLLYRFTTAFREAPRRLERFLAAMTVVLLVWTFALRDVPADGEPWSDAFVAYLVAFLAHWTILAVAVTIRLWRAGRGQPSVARRRMQLLSAAAAVLTVALFFAAFGDDPDPRLELFVELLSTLSAAGFLLGVAPPAPLRLLWRRPEQRRLQQAIADLMGATTEQEVVQQVLPPMARMVGARTVVLRDGEGRLLGAYGAADDTDADPMRPDVMRFPLPFGSLEVWTTPYAPFFGTEEVQLLRTLGALTGLALDRSRLFAQERDARASLERADELKTNFVALAAHELRTPVATIDGIVQTLDRHPELDAERRDLLERTLRQQSGQMRRLVDQLLDLSRLDADAIAIEPQPIPVRERVEAVVRAAAAENADAVQIEVPDDVRAVADPTAFERIVSNLVTNAFRYGNPPVIVRAETRDRHFRLSVEDRGSGVSPEFVPDLFERFTRSSNSRAVTGGTGLGLAIARSYAHAHGGDLLYEPAEPTGARFQLVLPLEPIASS
jgi:signal transduction histidine kinase